MQSPGRERCSLQKSCSQHFFFLGDVVLKEEPLRDARMERLRWVCGGGSAVILAKSLFPLAILPAGGLCAGRALPRSPHRVGDRSQSTDPPHTELAPGQKMPKAHSRWEQQPDPGPIPTLLARVWRAAESHPSQGLAPVSSLVFQIPLCSHQSELPSGSSASPKQLQAPKVRNSGNTSDGVAAPSTGCRGRKEPSCVLGSPGADWDAQEEQQERGSAPVSPSMNGPSMLQQPKPGPGARHSLTGAAPAFA